MRSNGTGRDRHVGMAKNAGLAAPVQRADAMPRRYDSKQLFYGHPDWVIAEVCRVHIQTARHWKSGIRKPGPSAMRLWELHAAERIVPDAWKGFGFRRDSLYDPEGHEITAQQLRAYPFVLQLANDFARQNPQAQSLIERLVLPAPRAARPRPRKPEPFMPNDQFLAATEAEREAGLL